jgi:hypothetical protein
MKGWKTWVGAAIVGLSAALDALGDLFPGHGLSEAAKVLVQLGAALTAIGIGHKIEKAANGKGGGE